MTGQAPKRLLATLKFRRAVAMVWESAPGWTALNFVLAALQGVIPFLTLFFFKELIDAITDDLYVHGSAAATHRVIRTLIFTALTTIMSSALRSCATVSGEHQSQEVIDRMQFALQKQSVAIDLSYYENSSYYDTLHRAQLEAPFRATKVVSNLTQLVLSAASLCAVAVLIFVSIRWQLALILLGLSLPSIAVKVLFADRLYKWQRAHTMVERLGNYYNWLLTSESSAKEIRLFSLGRLFISRSAESRKIMRQGKLKITRERAAADGVTDAVSTAAVYFTFGVIALSAVSGATTIGTLVISFQAIQRCQTALQELLGGFADLYENNLFLNNLYEFLELGPKMVDPAEPVPFPERMSEGISFRDVSFCYEGSEKSVLNHVNLTIHAGESVALVGENGAGKTTLIKLLCKLYRPTSGSIEIDGESLESMSGEALRSKISVVFQDYLRYNMTARENIWLGDTDIDLGSGRIERAAADSGADRVIEALQEKYETQLGFMFDGGVELSTGQWQKVALARAFLRSSPILLLDEPSSALDAQSEYELFETFAKLVKGRTAVLVSHRLSTVRLADRIIVLNDGGIVEQGTHDELMMSGGEYAKMFEMQVKSYSGTVKSVN